MKKLKNSDSKGGSEYSSLEYAQLAARADMSKSFLMPYFNLNDHF